MKVIESNVLLSRLRTSEFGRSFLILDECASTNETAAQMANEGASHGFTVIAKKQTKGRGRHGGIWFSPEGGIWMSIVLRPPQSFEPLHGIPLISALGVVRAINAILGFRTSVRWPNDVFFKNRKLAGTLVEAKLTGNTLDYAVLGLGVNANFPSSMFPDTAGNATTLSDIIGHRIENAELATQILFEVEQLYGHARSGRFSEILGLVRQNDSSRGKRVEIELEKEKVFGSFDDYLTLTVVQIVDDRGFRREIETSSAVSVAYHDV